MGAVTSAPIMSSTSDSVLVAYRACNASRAPWWADWCIVIGSRAELKLPALSCSSAGSIGGLSNSLSSASAPLPWPEVAFLSCKALTFPHFFGLGAILGATILGAALGAALAALEGSI